MSIDSLFRNKAGLHGAGTGGVAEVAKVAVAPTYEGRPVVKNPEGSWSHERSAGVEVEGKHMNIPTMFGGKRVSVDEAIKILRQNNWVDPETGKKIPVFKSQAEADKAAQEKEQAQQLIK